ncbi:MAG TPA: malectin domain-containing carbohydrate-binding protein [Bacillota bacterium]|nr:malectin domain-containing carbohydrate-binding protein [Bacillota bacterium]
MKKNIFGRKQSVLFILVLFVLLISVVPYAIVTANSLTTVNLSGTWTFTPQGGSATTIQVPGGGWYKQGFTSVNEADYQRTITIPNAGQPQVTKIEFGAINYEASLYINNTLVGTQRTSYTPSVFDITNFVTPGNSYTLKVHVKGKNASSLWSGGRSLVPNAAGWCKNTPQGIFRSAQIVVYPQIYISDAFVRPSVQNSNLYYDVWVTNASGSSSSLTISGSLSSWNGTVFSYPAIGDQSFTVNANTTSKITVGPIAWSLGTASYWWPNVPYTSGYTAQLHNLNLTLKQSGATKDTKTIRFGFREVVQKSDGTNTNYYLNGIRVNFRGDNLQGANYDSINYGGIGDAYDTYPGFLPGTNGWPKAVDNYQRLNYNVNRIHQEPATPYMLDVCDEKGFMIIEETAIRGSSNDQDFINGHDNMVNHLKALFTRDRNHPSIVRWSTCNEPDNSNSDSTQFQLDLYNATMSVDNTRPISIDPFGKNTYETIKYSNLSVIKHYSSGIGNFTEEVNARTDRPYGQGEFIWNRDSTKQGFTWFATSTQAMRQRNAHDIRPYTLLSAWASIIPGVKNTDMVIEQGGNPVYGENNMSDPWNHYQIKRVQAGFNPVLVADRDYWNANKLSDSNGNWPVSIPSLRGNTQVTRTLNIFNDTFAGATVDVYWEVRAGSATGTLLSSGELHPTVTLGYMSTQSISFTTPASGNIYLVLYSKKSGVEIFRETSIVFSITPGGPTPTPTPTLRPGTPTPTPIPGTISIAAGSSSAVGSFQADQYYSGGSTYNNTNTIDISQITSNPPTAALFNNERYGAMSYTIPGFTSGNSYTVTLYFAETYLTTAGSRLFSVSINGATVLSNFDIYATAGGQNKAIARSFTATANSSGQIVIQFIAGTENPKVNGISIKPVVGTPTPTPTATPTPTGVVNTPTPTPTGSVSISIAAGRTSALGSFLSDQYYSGGSTYSNTNTVDVSQITSNPPPAALFNNERYGAMSYTVPGFLAGSSYTVTLYFAETYLTASGRRLFNVSLNGATVLSNFDIYASAGGQNKAIARSFTTTANANGQIVIQFISGTENPKINGISFK